MRHSDTALEQCARKYLNAGLTEPCIRAKVRLGDLRPLQAGPGLSSPRTTMSRFLNLRRSGLMIGLIWAGAIGTIRAGEPAEDKIARLHVSFDSHARETAGAADKVALADEQPNGEFTADDVLHLRKMIVTERRQQLIERDLLTPKGRLDLAKKRYLTPAYQKTLGPLAQVAAYYFDFLAIFGGWHPNDAEAMLLYEDDAQKRRNTEMAELLSLARFGGPEPGQIRLDKPLDRSRAKVGIVINGNSTP